jgi:hypothetical protein
MDVPLMLRVDLLSMVQPTSIYQSSLLEKRLELLDLVILKKYQKESIQELSREIMAIKER